MSQASLLAFVPAWVSNWLTPIWIVGVGALLGLVLVVLFWLVVLGLSRVPFVRGVAESPARRRVAGWSLAICVFLVLAGWTVQRYFAASPSEKALRGPANMMMALGLLAPVVLVSAFGLLSLCRPAAAREIPESVREGPLAWIGTVALALGVFGILGSLIAFQPVGILESLIRLPVVGEQQMHCVIPPASRSGWDDPSRDPPQHPIDVRFRVSELRRLQFRSNEELTIDTREAGEIDVDPPFRVRAGEDTIWFKQPEKTPFKDLEEVRKLYVRNYGSGDASLEITATTLPAHPEAGSILFVALAVLGAFFAYLFQRASMPKLTAVTLSTFKSEVAQPLFAIVLVLGIVSLVLFIFIPYNTLGEDIKVLKDSGMTLIMVLCIIEAIWAASTSVADEIEGRTALTVLSKPIGRRSFIIGKYLGILWTVAVLFIVLGAVFLICVAYKAIYDAREGAESEPTWQICHFQMMGVVPGLLLAFMETAVLAAISVAISTRLPMLANFIICFSIYVLGHLTPLVVQSSAAMFDPVHFVAELVATILPVLDHFNIQAAIAGGRGVPADYLGWSLVYCLLYGMISLSLALLLFEDRDLA